nr:MAG TPA: hypothetical protein [Caudoviricetes sp.]
MPTKAFHILIANSSGKTACKCAQRSKNRTENYRTNKPLSKTVTLLLKLNIRRFARRTDQRRYFLLYSLLLGCLIVRNALHEHRIFIMLVNERCYFLWSCTSEVSYLGCDLYPPHKPLMRRKYRHRVKCNAIQRLLWHRCRSFVRYITDRMPAIRTKLARHFSAAIDTELTHHRHSSRRYYSNSTKKSGFLQTKRQHRAVLL